MNGKDFFHHFVSFVCCVTTIFCLGSFSNQPQRVSASSFNELASSASIPLWKLLGPYGGSVQSIVFSPAFASDHTVFAAIGNAGYAGVGHGVFKSIDGGQTWTAINNGLYATVNNSGLNVSALAISPGFAADHTLFAASAGLWRSTDGGNSWSVLSATINAQVLALSPNFASDQTIFAGVGGATVYRSTDGGGTWKSSTACCGPGLAASPDFIHDNTVFAGRARSTDGGKTFSTIIDGSSSGEAFVFSPAYASDHTMFYGDGSGSIFTSTSKGDHGTWTVLGNAGSNILALTISPLFASDQTFWASVSGQGVKRSTNGGANWSPLTNGLPGKEDGYTVALSPAYASNHLLLAGMRSGLYRSTNQGDQWIASQSGLNGVTVRQVMVSSGYATDGTLFVSTGMDSFKSTNGGITWQRLGMDAQGYSALVAISPNYFHDHTVFALDNQNGQLYRSTDGGSTWNLMAQPALSAAATVWAISPQYAVDHTLWAASKVSSSGLVLQLARSSDGAQSWSPGVEMNRWAVVHAIALAPDFDQNGHALIATEEGNFSNGSYAGFYASTDGGNTWPYDGLWSDCTSTPCWPTTGYSVAFSPAYATDKTAFIGTNSAGVWYTTQGIASSAWVKGSFPVTQTVNSLAVSPAFSSDGQLWAGTTSAGVFTSIDRGKNWSPLNAGLAELRILALTTLSSFTPDKAIFAATDSGLWVNTTKLSHVSLPLITR
jgi:photosystem II stability/assembly factor-like uncharacterized protein